MITILYFASVREQLNCASEQVEYSSDIQTVADLQKRLSQRDEIWSDVFANNDLMFSSVNQVIAKNSQSIDDGDEVAFFPQVTGG